MPRVLFIIEKWPGQGAAALAEAVFEAGFEVDVVTNASAGTTAGSAVDGAYAVIRLPMEPPRSNGFLFALRNALFFGAAANPGNYAMLRDRLHLHLQEVLYDAVIILCPPQIYLRLGFWIDETFGIPVWVHLTQALAPEGAGLTAWNTARLQRKYLAAAKILSADAAEMLPAGADARQLRLVQPAGEAGRFRDTQGGGAYPVKELLRRINRKQG